VVHAGSSNGGADTSSHRISPAFRAQSRAFVARFGGGPSGYFIGNNRAGRPALYRFGGTSAEEVVENVEDLDFLFGTDTDGDGAVDAYLTAAEVTAANRWDRVYSVRVSLVAVSTEAVTNSGSQVIYLRDTDGDTVADAQTTAADRRLRQVFTTTVALRNRLP
jgi:type IV pilus assembly protein PilW